MYILEKYCIYNYIITGGSRPINKAWEFLCETKMFFLYND